jgi:hypothetical protein
LAVLIGGRGYLELKAKVFRSVFHWKVLTADERRKTCYSTVRHGRSKSQSKKLYAGKSREVWVT